MVKKIALLVTAFAALTALSAPGFAGAAELTEGPGNPIKIPATITFTSGTEVFASNSLETETELGTLKCQQIMLEAELTQNSGGVVKGGNGGGIASNCTLEGEPFTVASIAINSIQASSGGNTASFSFVAEFFGGSLVCEWSGTGNFTYTSGSSEATLAPTALTPNEPVCGGATIHGKLLMETQNGTPVQLD
jgi:hypothetical protein